MRPTVTIALVGDYQPTVLAHQAIPLALEEVARLTQVHLQHKWIPTGSIRTKERLAGLDGVWCVPASPYRSMEGALFAIRHAREAGIPFLGTCGGFQHALIEYARNVLGWADADHAETSPVARRAIISPLACALVATTGVIQLAPGTRIAAAYGATEVSETYQCRYGVNPKFQTELLNGSLSASANDVNGEVRAVELDGHPFFVATLFQPERAALDNRRAPLVEAFVRSCMGAQD